MSYLNVTDKDFWNKRTEEFNRLQEIYFNRVYGVFRIMKPPTAPRTPKVDKPETTGWEGAD